MADRTEELRQCVLRAPGSPFRQADCRAVWADLIAGNCKVVDAFFSPERCYLVVADDSVPSPRHGSRARDVRVLEQVASGMPQKVVSLEHGISPSMVTFIVSHYLQFLGLCCQPSQIPLALCMLVCATVEGRTLRDAQSSVIEFDGKCHRAISAPRPEQAVAQMLSPAQLETVRLLLEGRRHAQIATARRTSRRTVANQLGSAFQRLGVSGRSELMRSLALRSQVTP
jgi:DNA-binding CsgD family transcriptional regulator